MNEKKNAATVHYSELLLLIASIFHRFKYSVFEPFVPGEI